ncbi:MAG: CDP-diacylglycerol--glycerol-3-phosphate 3-phosphatidyltransferase [Lachnospiraceae bacterium]|nr:CDP-diacylglycerol--glycerol-3-phosphate 3-phosphatidyltransferase [Lachnospiraceae bacterium]
MLRKMNLPNKLTLVRIALITVFVILMYLPYRQDIMKWLALAVYLIACLTDMADGMIARKFHLITNFGKFMDPLADKLLVTAAMICLVDLKRLPVWAVIIIVAREFIISGVRLVAADNGIVIAASFWGKLKTVAQMAMTILMIANLERLQKVTTIIMWIAVILTVLSLVDYLYKNKAVLLEGSPHKSEREKLYETLLARKETMTTAESCTGGMLGEELTKQSGISEVYTGGFITYTNRQKEEMLSVPAEMLATEGAISRNVAEAMAKGAAERTGADLSLSVTGNAGPKAQEKKKLGLVYIGCTYHGETVSEEHHLKGAREAVRAQAVEKALLLANRMVMREENTQA